MLGAVWAPRPGLSFYASGGGAFAPPAPLVVGEREPEESRQVEVGARRELWGGRLRTTLAAYELRRENIAIPDATGVTRQTGDQRARGVELEAAADLGGGRRAFFAYAWSDSELTRFTELQGFGLPPTVFVLLDRSGNRSPFAPEHLASLWLSQRFGSGWGLAGGGRWVGEQTIAPDNQVGIDGYLLLDAALSYGAGDWRLSLHLKNLTDEEYETRGLGVGSVIPGAPRSATVGVEVRW
jgi:catecholate siderophore receptor